MEDRFNRIGNNRHERYKGLQLLLAKERATERIPHYNGQDIGIFLETFNYELSRAKIDWNR